MATGKINILAITVRNRQAYEVAELVLREKFSGRKSTEKVEVNLAPCAKLLFKSRRDYERFERAVASALTA